jgi:hypothetical protein
VEAFHYKCEAFIIITRLVDEIFREMEALIIKLRLFEGIFNGTEAFKIISRDITAFLLM